MGFFDFLLHRMPKQEIKLAWDVKWGNGRPPNRPRWLSCRRMPRVRPMAGNNTRVGVPSAKTCLQRG
eukprot:11190073-Lingulodinium_polyedra.AAC.1